MHDIHLLTVYINTSVITAVPALLAKRDLTGSVTAMDALLTQQPLAQQILTHEWPLHDDHYEEPIYLVLNLRLGVWQSNCACTAWGTADREDGEQGSGRMEIPTLQRSICT